MFDPNLKSGLIDEEPDEDGDDHPMRSEADQRELDDHPYPKFGVSDEDEPTNGRWAAAEDDRRWGRKEDV